MENYPNAIDIKNLYKKYKLYNKPTDRLKEALHPLKKKYHKDFFAVSDISLEVRKGETVGIIGKNGSGKSTLLKMITGVLSPTSGTVKINGRISALLELGAGFNPEYTGLENIYLNGTIMGFTKNEIDGKLNGILDFADIGEFIHQPVKLYSSGMFVRLAFAVAINVDPDILIVDEALAVGDVSFQNKCFRKIEDFKSSGKTILFVTHSLDLVTRHCDRAILIQDGNLIAQGITNDVINTYTQLMTSNNKIMNIKVKKESTEDNEMVFFRGFVSSQYHLRNSYNRNEHRWGDNRANIIDYLIVVNGEEDPISIKANSHVDIYVQYKINEDLKGFMCGMICKTLDGVVVFTHNTRLANITFQHRKAGDIFVVKFSFVARLLNGKFTISLGCSENLGTDGQDTIALDRRNDSIILEIFNPLEANGIVDPDISIEVIETI